MGSPPPAAPVQLQPHRELMGKASPGNSFKPQSKPGLYDIIVFHTAKAMFSSCLFSVGTAQGLALSAHCSNSSTHSITSLSLLLAPQPHFGVGLHQFNISALRAMALRGVLEGLFRKAAAWAPNNTGLLGLERNHFLQQSSKDQRNQPMSNQDFLFHLPTPPPPIPTQGIHVSQQVGVGLERGRQPLAPRPV